MKSWQRCSLSMSLGPTSNEIKYNTTLQHLFLKTFSRQDINTILFISQCFFVEKHFFLLFSWHKSNFNSTIFHFFVIMEAIMEAFWGRPTAGPITNKWYFEPQVTFAEKPVYCKKSWLGFVYQIHPHTNIYTLCKKSIKAICTYKRITNDSGFWLFLQQIAVIKSPSKNAWTSWKKVALENNEL